MERARQLLRDLVAINSVNPSLVPGAPGEAEAAACLAACLRESGLDVTETEVAPGRPNVVGVLEGAQPGPTLLLCGHLDTVGVEGMEDPFTPVERDGRLYGRGTQDMKSGLAACVGAARLLAAEGLPKGRVLVAGVVDEEYASLGAEALVRDWRADGAVITEPTDLSVAVAHKGFAWLELQTHGKAAHGSRPEEGRDAILAMGRVLGVLERFDLELRARPTHPLLGSGSLHASTIAGGTEASVYPAQCRLFMERRTLPGEDGARALHEVEQMLAVLRQNDPEFRADVRLVVERPALRPRPGGRTAPATDRGRARTRPRGACHGHELLDRCRDLRRRGHSDRDLRPARRGTAQPRGVRGTGERRRVRVHARRARASVPGLGPRVARR